MSDETAAEIPATPMTIEERLAYLEEQNEGLKRVGKLLLGLTLVTALLLGWTQTNQGRAIQTEALILGASGTPRGTLTTTPNNHLAFMFFDHLGILPPTPNFNAIPYLDGFVIYDRQGKPRIVLGVNDQDQALLDVFGPDGKLQFSGVPQDRSGGAAPTGAAPKGTAPAPAPGTIPATPPATKAP